MFKILFEVYSLIIFLLCLQQVQPVSNFRANTEENSFPDVEAGNDLSGDNDLSCDNDFSGTRSEGNALSFTESMLESIEPEGKSYLEVEAGNDLSSSRPESSFLEAGADNDLTSNRSEGSLPSFKCPSAKRNDDKNMESKLDALLQKLENINSKSSTDHSRLHDVNLNCLQNGANLEDECSVCSDTHKDGAFVFKLPNSDLSPFYAYCRRLDDKSTWTVIQRREDGSINFNRGWHDYKHGFGDVYGEYWIGLERLHVLTKSREFELRVYLEDFDGSSRIANYSRFFVANEVEGYRLTVGAYSGDAGDSLVKHNSLKFTTYDRNSREEGRNCAQKYKGGWWYDDCYRCNPNGEYFSYSNRYTYGGVDWNDWKSTSLRRVIMSIRPV